MHTTAAFEEDETPTRKILNVPSATLALAARMNRLAELAAEKLQVDPDADAILSAIDDLTAIRSLASAVLPVSR
jgi:hypothetical protein